MNDFSISNHPTLVSVTRYAALKKLVADTAGKTLTLYLKIKHYVDSIYVSEMDKDIIAIADNNIDSETPYINPATGEPIGEYDYWEFNVENGATLLQLLQGGIAAMDANGRINEKCEYNQ